MVDRTDIDAVVDDASEQLALVAEMYAGTLEEQKVSAKLRTRIKNIVENQRSALEYLAHAIYEHYGDGKGKKVYYPLANGPTQFPGLFDARVPGVAANCPKVRDA